jgi:glycosyltransferase involved in cell wall biosynthesis
MAVSLTMIVKNEERTLGRCLDSVRGVFDEIVIVDTGSTDHTKTIAASYGAKIYDFAWCDDFSAARQYALDRATGDWVVWLDSDDVVEGAEHIRTRVERAPAELKQFLWRYVTAWDSTGEPTFSYWRERCVRNDGTFRWAGVAHEVLVAQSPGPAEHVAEIVVRHHPEPAKPGKAIRNVEILAKHYEANVGAIEPRMLFYLGRELSDTGQIERAIEILEQYDAVSQWIDERYHGKLLLAHLHAIGRDFDRATEIYFEAMKLLPLWPNAYFGLAAMSYFKQEWRLVAHWTDIGRSLPLSDTLLFVNQQSLDYDWIIHYTNALFNLGKISEALAWTEHALAINPADPMHVNNRDFFSKLVEQLAEEDPNGVCPPPANVPELVGAPG